ncbi:MAG: fructosamine kinase family protein [Bacteroidota bacterium]
MITSLPSEIRSHCEKQLGPIKDFTPVSGGCINNGCCLKTHKGPVFVKWNSAKKFPQMFTEEKSGLALLGKADCIRIPKVLSCYEGEQYSCLLLEWIASAPRDKNYWSALGQQLADLHRQTQNYFGLDHDNYIGSLHQYNSQTDKGVDFFIEQRLMPQVRLAQKTGRVDLNDVHKFDILYKELPSLLTNEAASLTHGDLWSGNLMTDDKGMPTLIDPAVSYTHREVDLGYTILFGGFDQEFYQIYNESFPLLSGYRERLEIYNLYPLLVHVNLFGGGYRQQVMSIMNRYI